MQVSQIHVCRNKIRIETDRRLEFCFRLRCIASIGVETSEVDARFRAVRIVSLPGDLLRASGLGGDAVVCALLLRGGGCKHVAALLLARVDELLALLRQVRDAR